MSFKRTITSVLSRVAIGAALSLAVVGLTQAANPVLKIGFVGVTSGPAAAWGISNQRSMETRAAWINETGGVKIGDTTYDVEIVSFTTVVNKGGGINKKDWVDTRVGMGWGKLGRRGTSRHNFPQPIPK